jgi:CubicO group peptidase (beta-lactamase class C family)
MRPASVAAAAALVAFGAPSLGAQEPYPGLDAYIAKAVMTWKIPGMSVAIVRNDSVIYAKGFGTLSAQNHAAVNEQTLFEIGSSSKAFTATLVAMLVSDGKIRWEDHLTDYLPGFRLYDPVANEAVTIRDALTHRSGIARGELAWLGSGIGRDEVLHRIRFLKPESPFRSKYSYQNMMFLAAGQAAGKAGGSTWDELVRQRIFEPLGMTSSVTTSKGLAATNVARPHGLDHDTALVEPMFDGDNIGPAGAILSNAKDMGQWLRFQLSDGVVSGKRLVNSAALREIHSPQILVVNQPQLRCGPPPPRDSIPVTHFSSYGMGWFIEDYHGQLMWQHGGNTTGMTAAVGMLPEKHIGVAVLSNMAGAQLPAIVMHYIFDRALGLPMKDLSAETYDRYIALRRCVDSVTAAQDAAHPKDAKPSLPLNAFVGTYADSLYGEATVSMVEGQLELRRGDWHGPLQFWNANNFRWLLPPGSPAGAALPIKFEIAADNTVSGLWFGISSDVTLLSRKNTGRGGGRGRGGAP